jgi:hypothetical protein
MLLTDLLHLVTRTWIPPTKLPNRLTMVIPSLADVNNCRQTDKVASQCHECAKLLAAHCATSRTGQFNDVEQHLYVWRKPYPEKASVKMWNRDTMSFTGMTLEDFQNFLMANFTLKTATATGSCQR